MESQNDREREVRFGVSQEREILTEWGKRSKYASGTARSIVGPQFADFDRILLSKEGLPLCYVEIKARRSSWGRYPDVIFPKRKHTFARRLAGYNLALIGVTRYGDGTIVEVNLGDTPADIVQIERRDRPGQSFPHAVYRGDQLTVYKPQVGVYSHH
jgi:hypothetical protein